MADDFSASDVPPSSGDPPVAPAAAAAPLPRPSFHGHPARPVTATEAVTVTCIDYSPEQWECREIIDLPAFLSQHRPSWAAVRWINVDGLSNRDVIEAIAKKYDLHPLAMDDVLNPSQRPRVEEFPTSEEHPGRIFVVVRMIRLDADRLRNEQVSFFLGHSTLLTFQQSKSGVFEGIRQRLAVRDSRVRRGDVGMLFHALLDAILDPLFPILEVYSERLEMIERSVLSTARPGTLKLIHRAKRDLLLLRRATWPLRDVIHQLQREPRGCLSETAQIYLRDLNGHVIQLIDLLETYREFAAGLTETYMSVVSNRMNEVITTLTIISTIFVPLTFIAGVYGMNMPIPENGWKWSYPIFWTFCLSAIGGMLLWFRRRGWF
jgi:magnesium transporter